MKISILYLIVVLFLAQQLNAGYNEELIKAVQISGAPSPVLIEKTITLKSFNNIKLSMLKIQGNYTPILASTDGKYILVLSQLITLSNEDTLMYQAFMQEIQAKNNGKAISLLKGLPKDSFLELSSFSKQPKSTFYIISDPECPFCREELKNIEAKLATSNVKIIFAPVHEKPSLIKSALIMKEAIGTTSEKLKVLSKYFSPDFSIEVSVKDAEHIDISSISKNITTFHESRAIKGVPFIWESPNE